MTREETIKWLESLKSEIGKSEHRTLWHYAESLDVAIEALSERNIARDIATILENEQDMKVMLQNAERPKGEWIDQDKGAFYPYECSICHEQPIWDDGGYILTNFCPNCGARMRGEEE